MAAASVPHLQVYEESNEACGIGDGNCFLAFKFWYFFLTTKATGGQLT